MYLSVNKPVTPARGLGFDMSSLASVGTSLIGMIPGMGTITALPLASEILDVGTKLGAGYLTQLTTKVDTTAADTAFATDFLKAQQTQAAQIAAQQTAAAQVAAKVESDRQAAALEQQRISLQQQLVAAQQQGNAAQVAQLQSALTRLPAPAGMSTLTKVAIGGGCAVALLVGVYLVTKRK
jgi:hypothetical protein